MKVEKRLPVVVIVGRPNVGKSTLFNRLVRRRVAVVDDAPGVTRDRLYAETEWGGKRFTVVDTGGFLFDKSDPLVEQIRIQAEVALAEADVVLFLTEAPAGLTPDDRDLAERFRGFQRPVFVVVNKVDSKTRDALVGEFWELGVGDVYPVSATHGRGLDDLMDQVAALLPEAEPTAPQEEVRIAILGRPNVGKSSLLNAFAGETRTIVSEIPGTTRDAIDTLIRFKGKHIRLIDTAGIRRKGKIQGSVEYYMVNRAQRALERAECAVIVVDGDEGLLDGDKRVAKMAHEEGRALVWAVNKWDLVDPPNGLPGKKTDAKVRFQRTLENEMPESKYAEAVFLSAKEGSGLAAVLKAALRAVESHSFRIPTGPLNRLIQDATDFRPYSRQGKALRIYYATQVATRPPTVALFCNDPKLLHFSYERYLENRIRQGFPMRGTPLRIVARSSHGRGE